MWAKTPWRYNPVQGGSYKGEDAKTLEFRQSNNKLFAKVEPLRWASARGSTPPATPRSIRHPHLATGSDHTRVRLSRKMAPRRSRSGGPPTGQDYLTDDLGARTVRFVEGRSTKEKPFVLYYCPFAVHAPFQAPEKTVKHFTTKKQRGHLGRDNATYAAMLKHLDDSVGDIRAIPEKTGLAKNTVLIFTSDNGGVEYTKPATTDNQPFKGGKACLDEGGVRVRTIVWHPGPSEP